MTKKKDNRVLGRRGARIMDEKETSGVNGGLRTLTACSFDARAGADGDQFTGDCLSK
jgi:hypothetical protein